MLQATRKAAGDTGQARDWLVSELKPALFAQHSAAQPREPWTGWFDVAVWLKTPAGAMQRLELELVYRDGTGEHRVPVDACPAGGHKTVLLNGSLPLSVTGRVQWAGLFLKRLAPEILVNTDMCHMQPRERRAAA